IAALLDGELRGDGELEIAGVQALHRAGPNEIAYAAREREGALDGVRAGALVVARDGGAVFAHRILVENPQLAFARLLAY
ncbi:LpxD N-terminal domain-containing protein, partial [Klebsiella pneumoniae]|uniref:LpxD N-terminal domain-containing protein n=1 Tax=Klebsiella pneumoniae TaxID=573 RepID=UPI00272FD5DA